MAVRRVVMVRAVAAGHTLSGYPSHARTYTSRTRAHKAGGARCAVQDRRIGRCPHRLTFVHCVTMASSPALRIALMKIVSSVAAVATCDTSR